MERDIADEIRLIGALSGWINQRDIDEAIAHEREALAKEREPRSIKSSDNRGPIAQARQPEFDAELFALIDEYRKREVAVNERGIADDERERRCDLSREILEQINATRPKTFAGILAVLDLGGEIEDPHHWPEEAIEGLREVVGDYVKAETLLRAARREAQP